MEKLKIFVGFFSCILFIFLLHSCSPLAEEGKFESNKVNILTSKLSQQPEKPDSEEKEEDNSEEEGDNEEEEEEDNNEEENDALDVEPVGQEFDGSETPEAGDHPITRDLY